MLIHKFYALVLEDTIRFGIIGKDIMINLVKEIENHKWGMFEAWLDAHHDLLIQWHEAEAMDSSMGSMPP